VAGGDYGSGVANEATDAAILNSTIYEQILED
jgi:hypothetical protein